MKAPTVRQMEKLVTGMKTSPCSSASSVKRPDRTAAAQILKPMIEAPAKMKVARLLNERFEGVVRMNPITPINKTTVTIKTTVWVTLKPIDTPKTADTTANTAAKANQ